MSYPTSELALVSGARATPTLSAFFQRLHPAIASSGALGRNISGFYDVATQRDATWTLLYGLQTNTAANVAAAVNAMGYGFQHQNADGSFANRLADPTQNASDNVFFMASFARVYLGVQNSGFWSTYGGQLQAMLPQARKAMGWLAGQVSLLTSQDRGGTNRQFFDAVAFQLNGQILNDPSLIATGKDFANQALAQQRPDGSFNEAGGFDSSYQATSMLNEATLITYSQDPAQAARLATSLARAATWEEAHIRPNGLITTEGNSRTGGGQEIGPSGEPKGVNYAEVSLSLYYAGSILGAAPATASAEAVTGYALAHSGGLASPMPVLARAAILPNAQGVAQGSAAADTLTATGPGQTLIGGGGADNFSIGANADAKIVVSGSGITTVLTSAPTYVLPAGVSNVSLGGAYPHVVTGNGGDNFITASGGNDTIYGGGGDVTIRAGLGRSTMTGGGHYNTFMFPKAADAGNTVTDFTVGHDVIDLRTMFQYAGWSPDRAADFIRLGQQDANAVITVDPDGTGPVAGHVLATLNNVTAAAMVPGIDYIFRS